MAQMASCSTLIRGLELGALSKEKGKGAGR
jgi:hypothetical protein